MAMHGQCVSECVCLCVCVCVREGQFWRCEVYEEGKGRQEKDRFRTVKGRNGEVRHTQI